MGFDLHYRNMPLVRPDDVVMPSIGGAGSSLLGNIVLELGLPYVDLNRDTLRPDGSVVPPSDAISRRIRTGRQGTPTAGRRFLKTHLPAGEFDRYEMGPVWLLVRDPRDALYSWYRYHRDFAELEWERVPDTFEAFLERPFFMGHPPADDWWMFYDGWRRHGHHVIRFEDLKSDPLATMRSALTAVGCDVPDASLRRAVEESSYAAMRRREDQVARPGDEARVMRSGRVGEWQSWMTPRLEPYFSSPALAEVAAAFGYDLAVHAGE